MPHSSNAFQNECIPCITSGNKERFITDIADGTLIGWRYFDLRNLSSVTLTLRGEGSGTFMILDELNGNVIGTLPVHDLPAWTEVTAEASPLSDNAPLYLRFQGEGRFDLLTLTLHAK
jgi:hypothetical protein